MREKALHELLKEQREERLDDLESRNAESQCGFLDDVITLLRETIQRVDRLEWMQHEQGNY